MLKFYSLLSILLTFSTSFAQISNSAEEVCPKKVGQTIPDFLLQNIDGKPVNIGRILKDRPTVLIFYRGSWCPYCNMHLSGLQEIENQIIQMGFQVIAISPDLPIKLQEVSKKNDLKYTLLSDSKMNFTKSMGLAFQVAESKVISYKEKNIDLEASSGETHHLLPVPAVYVVDTNGLIHFSYVNPNYKVRINPDILISACRSLVTIMGESE